MELKSKSFIYTLFHLDLNCLNLDSRTVIGKTYGGNNCDLGLFNFLRHTKFKQQKKKWIH